MRGANYVIIFSRPFQFRPIVISEASLMRFGSYVTSEPNTIWFISLLLHITHYEANNPETGDSVFNSAASRGRQQPRRPEKHRRNTG